MDKLIINGPVNDDDIIDEASRTMQHLTSCINGTLLDAPSHSTDAHFLRNFPSIRNGRGYGLARFAKKDDPSASVVVKIEDVQHALLVAYRAGARREAIRDDAKIDIGIGTTIENTVGLCIGPIGVRLEPSEARNIATTLMQCADECEKGGS